MGSKTGLPADNPPKKYCWMAIGSLGCLSEASGGFLGSAAIIDVAPMDLSDETDAEAYAEMMGVLQLATNGLFCNRSKVTGHILLPYILIK